MNRKREFALSFSNFIDPVQLHLICQMLAKFPGVESNRTVSELRKKRNITVLCSLYSIKQARDQDISCRRRAMTAKNCTIRVMNVQSYLITEN